jgi:hypothetical protein
VLAHRTAALLGLSVGMALAPGATAEDAALDAQLAQEREARGALQAEVQELRGVVEELRASRDKAETELSSLRASVSSLESRTPTRSGLNGGNGEVGVEKEGQRRLQQAERQILEQAKGVLLPGGQLVIEPGIEYSNISRNRVDLSGFSVIPALVIGKIDVAALDRDVYTAQVTSRYGLTDWLEAEITVPWIYREDDEVFGATGSEEIRRMSGDGLGDIQGGLFAQLLYEDREIPGAILNFRYRAPTGEDFSEVDLDARGRPTELPVGSGFWSFAPGFTLVKTTDPAVLFFSANYYFNLEDDKDIYGTVDPGDIFEWSAGMAFALNERLALSLSFQHQIGGRTTQNGDEVLRSDLNAGTFFIGGSYTANHVTAFTFNLGVGVTDDAPDLTLEIRMPLRMPFRGPVFEGPSLPGWLSSTRKDEKGRTILLSKRH